MRPTATDETTGETAGATNGKTYAAAEGPLAHPRRERKQPSRLLAGVLAAGGVFAGATSLAPPAARAADKPAREAPAEGARERTGAPAAAREVTLEQALAFARKGNHSLAVERTRVAQAETAVEQAWNVLFPTLTAQGKYTRNYTEFRFGGGPIFDDNGNVVRVDGKALKGPSLLIQPENQWDAGATLSTLLFAPAAYPALKAAKVSAEGATENLHAAEDSTLFAVAQAYLTAAVADEVMGVRDSNIAVSRATLDIAKTRFAAGAVTKVDVDRAQIAVLRAEQAKREAELSQREAYRALATLMAYGDQPFKVVPPSVPEDDTLPGEDLNLALKLRPEFRAVQLVAREADLERQAYAWRWAPSIAGFGNARVFNYDNFHFDRHAWAVGATLDWVIFDGGARDTQRHLQAARLAEAEARAVVLQDNIRDDIANGRDSIATKVQAQRTAEQSVALATETLELTRTQYEAGTATQIDLLTAQDALVSARDALARAHFDVAAAHLVLRRAAGTFPPR